MIKKYLSNRILITILCIFTNFVFFSIRTKCNNIKYVDESVILSIKNKNHCNTLMAELNADNWLTEDLFYENIGNAFTIFQCRDKRWIKEFWNYNLLLDYIRELHWIKEKKIILIIKNLSNCYISEKINKDEIINMFTNYVFLFWKNYNSKLIEPKYFHPKEIFVYYT